MPRLVTCSANLIDERTLARSTGPIQDSSDFLVIANRGLDRESGKDIGLSGARKDFGALVPEAWEYFFGN